ncbi:MAG: ATP-binding cassette domain-containing protein [Chitinophagaceae bacterium]
MNLLSILHSRSKVFYLFLIILGLISSVTNMGILVLISMTLGGEPLPLVGEYKAVAFILLLVLSFLATRFFQNYVVSLTNNILFDLELSIVQKVRNANYESFEKLGVNKIYAAISDARILSRVPEIFVTLINSFITLVCSLGYLFWISPAGGATVLVVMVNLLLIYLARNEKISKDLNEVRDLQNTYYRSLQELLFGFKQVRISSYRSNKLYNKHILANRDKAKGLSIGASRSYVVNQLIGVYSWYILFGVIMFLLPVILNLQVMEIAVFITAVLFMMSPLSQLISFFPFQTSCRIALQRIDGIYKELEVNAPKNGDDARFSKDFSTIRFENVTYVYTDSKSSFTLESLSVEINKGEVIFIVGGNGSGKSTFINLLTGLCVPESGKVFIDEQEVPWNEYVAFSNSMSVIYTNHHMFKENYDPYELSEDNERLLEYKHMLNLDGVLKINEEQNRVNTDLSKGQQKRVALLLGLMEDKPLVVLDEWAAEQDPKNRKHFYTKWLNEIRSMGKTIIAVSHDDDYYHVADRVIKFNYGKIVEDTAPVQTV